MDALIALQVEPDLDARSFCCGVLFFIKVVVVPALGLLLLLLL